MITIPGLIDPHVHLREPGAEHKEDFITGTKAALAGGFTAVIDMPNNPGAPTISAEALAAKISRAAARTCCEIGFHFGATPRNTDQFDAVTPDVFGLKLYLDHTTGDLLVERLAEMRRIMAAWPADKPLLVHAEDRTVAAVLGIVALRPRRVHFCHVSLRSEIEMIREAKEQGLPVTCEVAPHHLFLVDAVRETLGPYGDMKPPLQTPDDVAALWENLAVVDMIATDHAPHTRAEKEKSRGENEKKVYGVPGLETSLPLMLTAVAEGRLTLDRLVELMSDAPAHIFSIARYPGNQAEIDPNEEWTITEDNLYTKCGWTPFVGMRVKGRVKKVLLRGEVAYDGERVVAAPGSGMVIHPGAS